MLWLHFAYATAATEQHGMLELICNHWHSAVLCTSANKTIYVTISSRRPCPESLNEIYNVLQPKIQRTFWLHPLQKAAVVNFAYFPKGQLISKGLFKVFICTKKRTKLFLYFYPSL
jgi:hypothetical protein